MTIDFFTLEAEAKITPEQRLEWEEMGGPQIHRLNVPADQNHIIIPSLYIEAHEIQSVRWEPLKRNIPLEVKTDTVFLKKGLNVFRVLETGDVYFVIRGEDDRWKFVFDGGNIDRNLKEAEERKRPL